MKPEQERVIEAMATEAAKFSGDLSIGAKTAVFSILRAAAKEGFVLAKLPEEKEGPEFAPRDRYEHWEVGEVEGWNDCLDEIETIELEERDERS